jgi:hypothetical protein
MKQLLVTACAAVIALIYVVWPQSAVHLGAQAPQNANVPKIPFDTSTDFLKYSADMNLGEVLGIAVNSKGEIVVLNHPGSATSGPIYGNASTQLLLFDRNGKYVREIGRGVYGLGYAHSCASIKATTSGSSTKVSAVVKFNRPVRDQHLEWRRRARRSDEFWCPSGGEAAMRATVRHGQFQAPTDIAFDSDDNIYISDGFANSRVAEFDKHGNWVTSWGSRGRGRPRTKTPANSTRRTTSVSIARTTCMSRTATTAASRCSTPAASICGCFTSTRRTTRRGIRCLATPR